MHSDGADDAALGAAYLGLHTLRCRSRDTQYRLGAGTRLGPTPPSTRCCSATAEQRLYDTAHDLLPGAIELDESLLADRVSVLARSARSTAAPPRSNATSLPAGCSIWGRNDGGRHLGRRPGHAFADTLRKTDVGGFRPGARQGRSSSSAGSRCSRRCPTPQYLWCSGCSAKPAHTRR